MSFTLKARKYREGYGTAVPTSGQWSANDVIINESPAANGGPEKWVCVTGGTPGTWVAVGNLKDQSVVRTLSAAAAAALTDSLIVATAAANLTLAAPSAATSGNVITLLNTSVGNITLVAASGTEVVGTATVATVTGARLTSVGTSWYRS